MAEEPPTSHLTSSSLSFQGINNTSPKRSGIDKTLVWFRSSKVIFLKSIWKTVELNHHIRDSYYAEATRDVFFPHLFSACCPPASAAQPPASYSMFILVFF